MPLDEPYPAEFERLWSAYPKWPTGRSKKRPSFESFRRVKRALKLTDADLDQIILDIEQRIRWCVTWQKGSKFGPPMLSTYLNQRLWNEPYERVRRLPAPPVRGADAPSSGPVRRASDDQVSAVVDQALRSLGVARRPGRAP